MDVDRWNIDVNAWDTGCGWEFYLQVPHEAHEIAGMSIDFRSGKFGYSICHILSRGHAEIFREFWHDFCEKYDILEWPDNLDSHGVP